MHALECLKLVGAGTPLLKNAEFCWGLVRFLARSLRSLAAIWLVRSLRSLPRYNVAHLHSLFHLLSLEFFFLFFLSLFFSVQSWWTRGALAVHSWRHRGAIVVHSRNTYVAIVVHFRWTHGAIVVDSCILKRGLDLG